MGRSVNSVPLDGIYAGKWKLRFLGEISPISGA